MSESSERGKSYELKIAKITRQKLRLEVKRDGRSGAGDLHKEDLRDRYNEIPLAVECKNQETLKIKEWWRDADDKSSFGQMPAVVFPMETEDLVTMRYTDLLQLLREMMDYKEEVADLRKPPRLITSDNAPVEINPKSEKSVIITKTAAEAAEQVQRVAAKRTTRLCAGGHIADENGYCMQKGCKFRRGYKRPKEKK